MSPTRRQVVNAIAAGAVVPVTVASAEAQEQDSQDFSPDITIHSNNLVATIGARDDDVDPDTVSITTADGETHTFDGAARDEWNAGNEFDVGYTNGSSRARIEGSWHGVIREVTATRGDESVTETNDRASSLEVSCSMWQTPDEPPRQFAVVSEGATKQFWNHGGDGPDEQRRYGSPGRPLQTVVERNTEVEMQVDFEGCSPSTEKALRFNCTSVTVEEEELIQGGDRIDDVRLEFADGSTENPPGTADDADNGAYELPVTLEGTGDNAGKVIEKLHFKVLGDEYSYRNLDSANCTPETGGQQDSQESEETDEQQNEGDDSAESDSTSDDSTDAEDTNEDTPSDDSTSSGSTNDDSTSSDDSSGGSQPSSDSTSGQSSTNGGSTSGGTSGGGTSSRSTSGGSTGSDQSADETPTPTADSDTSTVSVNRTEEEHIQLNTSSTPENATPANASRTNAAAEASNEPSTATATSELTDAASAEDQPGLGFVSGLGGLLGFGELARRRLGRDENEDEE